MAGIAFSLSDCCKLRVPLARLFGIHITIKICAGPASCECTATPPSRAPSSDLPAPPAMLA
eukprot:13268189-Alexandrium_andersonii.AAC.1